MIIYHLLVADSNDDLPSLIINNIKPSTTIHDELILGTLLGLESVQ